MTRLSEVATVESGSGFPIVDQGVCDAEFPFLKVSDMNLPGNETEIKRWNHTVSEVVRQRLRARAFPAGTVIFPKIGAAIATNKKRLLTRPSCVDNNCMGVTADARKLDASYLYYLFQAKNLSDFASDSNPPSIRKTEVESWEIIVPPLGDQRRIVEQLSRAKNIVRMRREAEQKAKEIIPALFLDMFGDPVANPRGWERKTLGNVLTSIDSGKSPPCVDRHRRPREWGVLKLGAVTWGEYDESEHKTLPPTIEPYVASEVHAGDVLISRKNTYDLVGAPAYVWATDGRILLPDLIFRLKIADPAAVDGVFLWALLSIRSKRAQLRLLASGAAASMPNISKERLTRLPVEIPPINMQRRFSALAVRVRAMCAAQTHAMTQAGDVFRSLLAGALGEKPADA